MFCRSIGASDGQLLKITPQGTLRSISSVGLPKNFDIEFNQLIEKYQGQPTPHSEAFRRKEVIAIVDLKKDKMIAGWLLKFLDANKISSMVAVPLFGREESLGVLCAYYHDVCLFDGNTLEHLTMIGRMIGSAMERPTEMTADMGSDIGGHVVDDLLSQLNERGDTQARVFQLLADVIMKATTVGGVVVGPVKEEQDRLLFKIVGAAGIPDDERNSIYPLPPFLIQKLSVDEGLADVDVAGADQWGSLRHLLNGSSVKYFVFPLGSIEKKVGCVIGWISDDSQFGADMPALIARLAKIASLAICR